MIARNEMTTWGAKQVSDIFKDSETFYIFPNCLDSFIICAMFFGFAVFSRSWFQAESNFGQLRITHFYKNDGRKGQLYHS